MWKIKLFFLLVVVMSFSSATNQASKNAPKAKISAIKDPKEKRDVPSASSYSYEAPQKSFVTPSQVHVNQQKHTSVEQFIPQTKVAPLEYIPKQEAPQQLLQQFHYEPQQHQAQPQYYEAQQQYHPTSFNAPMTPLENLFHEAPVKQVEEYSLNYPHFEAYPQVPAVFFNDQYEKIISLPMKDVSSYKSSPYSYQTPAASYSYPQHTFAMSNHYAPSISASHYSSGFTQSPGAIFIPQAVAPAKSIGKIPDYAQGSKGLSHFSTVSSYAPVANSYAKQSYEVPSFAHISQTERPFKPSAFLGASLISHQHESYERPLTNENYIPSKAYLPAKEQQHYQQQYAAQAQPVEYQIQYIQYPVGKSYNAPVSSYLPSKQVIESPKSSYLPPSSAAPSKTYIPVAAPSKTYFPAAAPSKTYIPTSAPTKTYIPPSPQSVKIEKPKQSYIPPTNTYLPPNNPYASAHNHQQGQSAHSGHNQHHHHQQAQPAQQYSSQSHEVYDSSEYQSLLSGHHK